VARDMPPLTRKEFRQPIEMTGRCSPCLCKLDEYDGRFSPKSTVIRGVAMRSN